MTLSLASRWSERGADLLADRGRSPTVEYTLLAAYAALVTLVLAHHEPWFDEAQAWLLARDFGAWNLLAHELRYEGTPGLWHMLLSIPARSGLPYRSLGFVGATVAFAGVVLLVRRSPLPVLIRLTLPFTFFIAYQYAVVARSYNLVLLGLAAVALTYPDRLARPYRFIASCALLANISVHSFFLAWAIVGVWIIEVASRRGELPSDDLRRNATAAILFLAMSVLLVLQLWPPWDVWSPRLPSRNFRLHVYDSLIVLDDSIAENPIVTYVALGLSAVWFRKRRVLAIFLLGLASLLLLFALRYYSPWHQGIVFLYWIFCLWLSFVKQPADGPRWDRKVLPMLVTMSVLVVAALQIRWTAWTARMDWFHPYSGSQALASFLRQRQLENRQFFVKGFAAFAVQPYFRRNLFANYQDGRMPAALHWSVQLPVVRERMLVWKGSPEMVVFSLKRSYNFRSGRSPMYRPVATFAGGLFWKNRIFETDILTLFERLDLSSPSLPSPRAEHDTSVPAVR